jgi:hypothetical protein
MDLRSQRCGGHACRASSAGHARQDEGGARAVPQALLQCEAMFLARYCDDVFIEVGLQSPLALRDVYATKPSPFVKYFFLRED